MRLDTDTIPAAGPLVPRQMPPLFGDLHLPARLVVVSHCDARVRYTVERVGRRMGGSLRLGGRSLALLGVCSRDVQRRKPILAIRNQASPDPPRDERLHVLRHLRGTGEIREN